MKSFYRERLRIMKKYIKLSNLAKEYGLQQNTLSMFMNGADGCVSEQNIAGFVVYVENTLSDVIENVT